MSSAILYLALASSGWRLDVAPFVLYLTSFAFTAGILWQLLCGRRQKELLEGFLALPLGNRDRDCLYCLFLYPEKYWKQINFYFNGKKNWISARNIEKIHGLEQQEAGRNRFLSKIK